MSYDLCLHRWVGRQARYELFARPDGHALHVVCTPEALATLPADVTTDVVASLDDEAEVGRAVERALASRGVPRRIVALNEADLLTAARLRDRWDLPGGGVEAIEPFRDKLAMARAAQRQSGTRVLATVAAEGPAEDVVAATGLPVVVKPRFGTASRGVRVLDDLESLRHHLTELTEPSVAQSFCPAETRHVDGWWDGRRIVVGVASAYTVACGEFGETGALGSFELSPGPAEDRLLAAAAGLLEAFAEGRSEVFHLELFDDGHELTFLEVAARVGGAEIPFIWRDLHDIDLVGVAWELQTGWSSRFREEALAASHAGRPRATLRGGWVLARGHDLETYPSSVYWSRRGVSDEEDRPASGVYEGSDVRLRMRSCDEDTVADAARDLTDALTQRQFQGTQR